MNDTEKNKKDLWPATLYVEGSDQFRGWFNSSLITSTILNGKAPYQQVISHGFVVDGNGHKMSKSLNNAVDPEEIIKKFGADILRLWVASSDYTKEIKISISILENVQEGYQKIRNTLRFLISNISNSSLRWIKDEESLEKEIDNIDHYILHRLKKLLEESEKHYRNYSFNFIYHYLLNFCISDLSSFYFEISKDILYCDSFDSLRRKKIITTFYYLLVGLLKIIHPLLPYLFEEISQYVPFNFDLNFFSSEFFTEKKENDRIEKVFFPFRNEVLRFLEKARQEKIIDNNREADLLVCPKKEKVLEGLLISDLINWLSLSNIIIRKKAEDWIESKDYFFKIEKTNKQKCQRCDNYRDNLQNELCLRCQEFFN